ncbi:MAG TPA: VOC family protein [Actinomycetota bacterium]|nr:VOC family protein [Actinomycetota bacterium]
MTVPARVSLITLGVADVARATRFYETLGWRRSSASVEGEVSFFHTHGAIVGVYDETKLAEDVRLPGERPSRFRGVTLAINVGSEEEVVAALETARTAGAEIVDAERASWGGYVGYFTDPDGHVWEVAHNPGFPLADDGSITIPH